MPIKEVAGNSGGAPANSTIPKGNHKAAADWVRSVKGELELEVRDKIQVIKPQDELPKGQWSIYGITLDSRNGAGPLDSTGLTNLAGLGGLKKLVIETFELADEDLAFIGTLTDLESLIIGHNAKFQGTLLSSSPARKTPPR
ncbi:MAG: hypothetical protein IPK32_15325 [Verrucomicrobiaceae bacterium]|nr:hypothetical protein [Verrucomicrobiaceae bacterium]